VAASGAKLLEDDAVGVLVEELFPLATVVTPNLHEACALLGVPYSDDTDRGALAEALYELGAPAVIVTGGHGAEAVDWLFDGERHVAISVERHGEQATHGAGCTHSASLTALLARGETLEDAARGAAAIASEAVANGLASLGAGSGPVDAFHLDAHGARGVRAPR
jgi:hydroxymethylpyrimidine/phosphomethylpyrimidine kinase